jgi:hypothetical protein
MSKEPVISILQKLKEYNKKQSIAIYLPSLQKKVKFLPFTLKQQKEILSRLPTTASGLIMFNNIFNGIINDNCEEKIDLDDLNIFDRLAIAITYRISTIGDILDKEDIKVNLNTVIKNINSCKFTNNILKPTNITGENDISAILKIPSLKYDSIINNEVTKKITDTLTSQEILSELFTSEILKYIQSVTISGDVIDFKVLDYTQKLEFVEELPGTFVKHIFKFIENIKNLENTISTVDGVKVDISNELFA